MKYVKSVTCENCNLYFHRSLHQLSLSQPLKHLHLPLPPQQLSLLLASQLPRSLHTRMLAVGSHSGAQRDHRYISSPAKPAILHLSDWFTGLTLDWSQPTRSVHARSTNSACWAYTQLVPPANKALHTSHSYIVSHPPCTTPHSLQWTPWSKSELQSMGSRGPEFGFWLYNHVYN